VFIEMQLHNIKSNSANKSRKRIGRGGKRGTYSGRGLKGQKSRSGARIRPAYRDILKKLPKQRGFKFKSIKEKPVAINILDLEKNFKDGEIISPSALATKGMVVKFGGRLPKVKILATGEIKKKITVKDCLISVAAKEKIEKAGGKIT
jgi:large subunit ribosomal protein L15